MAVLRMTMKDQIYDELKKRIHCNMYSPGERINIDNIAREMEVSNSPVREAVNMLVKDGLLNTSVNAGSRVIELKPVDISELNQAIYMLLLGGYDICEAQGNLAVLEKQLCERLNAQKVLLQVNKLEDYINAAIYFDRAFLDVTGNSRLVNMYDSLADIFYLSVADRLRKKEVDHRYNMEEHLKLIDAVHNHDKSALVNTLKLHYHQ